MNLSDKLFLSFDTETGSRDPNRTQITQLAARFINAETLEPIEGAIFNSEVRPILDDNEAIAAGLDPIEDKALEITHKTREKLAQAPSKKIVWEKFIQFIKKYNPAGGWNAPIPLGYNIINFDIPIIDRLCREFGNVTKDKKEPNIFHPIYVVDGLHLLFGWMGHFPTVQSLSMDNNRKFFGFPEDSIEKSHDALVDINDQSNIIIKFLKYQRSLAKLEKFEGAFSNGKFYI